MRIALITEGTYPYVHGGVSVWCDHLIRTLPDIEFALYAITPAVGTGSVWSVPPNVTTIESISLEPVAGKRFDRYPRDEQRGFLAAYEAFLLSVLQEPTQREDAFLGAVRSLFDASRVIPIDVGVRSDAAFEVTRTCWTDRSVGDRLDQMGTPSLFDVLEVTSSLSRFLLALNVVPEGDVVHSTANGLGSLTALASRWTYGTPLLLTEHGIYLRERYLEAQKSEAESRVKAFQLLFFRRLNDATLQSVDLISPVSNYNRRWELETGADGSIIRTIYNGVDPAMFPPIVDEPDVPTVSWLGRVDPLKDVVTLIKSFAEVLDAIPNARLRLFGPVPEGNEVYHAACLETIDDLNLGDAVTFEGLISPAAGAFAAGHVVALSSISEGFPFTVLEAMMSGRATVSTDVGGVAEAVGNTGLLVAPRDPAAMAAALIRLLTDDELRHRLGAAARERALSNFTLAQMVDQYRNVYEELAQMPANKTHEMPRQAVGGGR